MFISRWRSFTCCWSRQRLVTSSKTWRHWGCSQKLWVGHFDVCWCCEIFYNNFTIPRFLNTAVLWTRRISSKMLSISSLPSTKLWPWAIVKVSTWRRSRLSSRWTRTRRKFFKLCARHKRRKPSKRCEKRQRNCSVSEWNLKRKEFQWGEALEAAETVLASRARVCRRRRRHPWAFLKSPNRRRQFLRRMLRRTRSSWAESRVTLIHLSISWRAKAKRSQTWLRPQHRRLHRLQRVQSLTCRLMSEYFLDYS